VWSLSWTKRKLGLVYRWSSILVSVEVEGVPLWMVQSEMQIYSVSSLSLRRVTALAMLAHSLPPPQVNRFQWQHRRDQIQSLFSQTMALVWTFLHQETPFGLLDTGVTRPCYARVEHPWQARVLPEPLHYTWNCIRLGKQKMSAVL